VRAGNAMPPIHGFALSGLSGEDSTEVVLSAPRALILFCENFNRPVSEWSESFTAVYQQAMSRQVPVYVISNRKELARELFNPYVFRDIPVFSCDNTTIRTAARTNPCLYLVEKGTVVAKAGSREMDRIVKLIQ
jgi:hypothetical protein